MTPPTEPAEKPQEVKEEIPSFWSFIRGICDDINNIKAECIASQIDNTLKRTGYTENTPPWVDDYREINNEYLKVKQEGVKSIVKFVKKTVKLTYYDPACYQMRGECRKCKERGYAQKANTCSNRKSFYTQFHFYLYDSLPFTHRFFMKLGAITEERDIWDIYWMPYYYLEYNFGDYGFTLTEPKKYRKSIILLFWIFMPLILFKIHILLKLFIIIFILLAIYWTIVDEY